VGGHTEVFSGNLKRSLRGRGKAMLSPAGVEDGIVTECFSDPSKVDVVVHRDLLPSNIDLERQIDRYQNELELGERGMERSAALCCCEQRIAHILL
jgi:hypothetical protein